MRFVARSLSLSCSWPLAFSMAWRCLLRAIHGQTTIFSIKKMPLTAKTFDAIPKLLLSTLLVNYAFIWIWNSFHSNQNRNKNDELKAKLSLQRANKTIFGQCNCLYIFVRSPLLRCCPLRHCFWKEVCFTWTWNVNKKLPRHCVTLCDSDKSTDDDVVERQPMMNTFIIVELVSVLSLWRQNTRQNCPNQYICTSG